jgi:proteasome lid subunit RPN8/RPN11
MSQPTRPSDLASSGKAQLRRLGAVYDDSIPIVLHERVFEEIVEYSHRDLRRETGGFLLGGLYEADRAYIEIRNFLPAVDTHSCAVSLTFTHDTWGAMNRQAAERFPDDKVVGWHHTHPGLGVFLSAYDLFVHRNYFSAPFHVALVVDPKAQEFGFFQWRGAEIVDCGFLFLFENAN